MAVGVAIPQRRPEVRMISQSHHISYHVNIAIQSIQSRHRYAHAKLSTHPSNIDAPSRNCQLMHSSLAQHVLAHWLIVAASPNGFKSPGHLPRKSSPSFHGARGQGGTCSRRAASTMLLLAPPFQSTFSGGMRKTESSAATTTSTASWPRRAIQRRRNSRAVPWCRWYFLFRKYK